MKRVSTDMSNYDMQYHLRNAEWRMNDLQNRMGTQSRIKNLRDDPIAAAHSVRLQSRMQRMNQFTKNVETVQGNYRVAETYIRSAVDIVQRIRELAIQGANDTYSREEKQYMAEEVNQLLNELVEIGNARFPDGSTIFSGDRTQTLPFRATYGRVEGTETAVITGLEYVGTIDRGRGEISEQSFIETRFPGNAVLWAEQQQILTPSDVTAYQVKADSSIFVDGREILLSAGDNISAVIAKINDAGLAVKGSLDPADNSLVLTTTVPHQIWLEDGAGGTVLRDLGVLNGFGKPPHNLASDVRVAGGSLFDAVRYLRDSLYRGDTIEIGGGALRGLDSGLRNLLGTLAELGAKDERLSTVASRLARELPELKNMEAGETGLDLAGAITDLKMLEYSHKAALQTAGRILQPTLLDYLR